MKLITIGTFMITLLGCKHQTKESLVDQSIQSETIRFDPNIALQFMNNYIDLIKEKGSESEWVEKNALATDNFKATYKKILEEAIREDPGYGLGFDPILYAQDYPENGFVISNYDSISGFVVLKGVDWEIFTVPVKLRLIDKNWLVDGAGLINISEDKLRKK